MPDPNRLRIFLVDDPHTEKHQKNLLKFEQERLSLYLCKHMQYLCRKHLELRDERCPKIGDEPLIEKSCEKLCNSRLMSKIGDDSWQPEWVKVQFFSSFPAAITHLHKNENWKLYHVFLVDLNPAGWDENRIEPTDAKSIGITWPPTEEDMTPGTKRLLGGRDVLIWLTQRRVTGLLVPGTRFSAIEAEVLRGDYRVDAFIPPPLTSKGNTITEKDWRGPLVIAELKRRLDLPCTLPEPKAIESFPSILNDSYQAGERETLIVDFTSEGKKKGTPVARVRLFGQMNNSAAELQEPKNSVKLRRLIRMADYSLPSEEASVKSDLNPKEISKGRTTLHYNASNVPTKYQRTAEILLSITHKTKKGKHQSAIKGEEAFMVVGAIRFLRDGFKAWDPRCITEDLKKHSTEGIAFLVSVEQEWLAINRAVQSLVEIEDAGDSYRKLALSRANRYFTIAAEWRDREHYWIELDHDLEYLIMPDVGQLCVSLESSAGINPTDDERGLAKAICIALVESLGHTRKNEGNRTAAYWITLLSPVTKVLWAICRGEEGSRSKLRKAILRAYDPKLMIGGRPFRESLYRRVYEPLLLK